MRSTLLRLGLIAFASACSPEPSTTTITGAAEAGTPPTPSYSRNLPDSVVGGSSPIVVTGTIANCTPGSPCFIAEANRPSGEIDSYLGDVYERPAGQGSAASSYYPAIDIVSADTGVTPVWVFYRLNLFGPDAGQPGSPSSLPYFYGVEVNYDADPQGDAIIELESPSSNLGNDWSTAKLVVTTDRNETVGGPRPLVADGPNQTAGGYEHEVFDSGTNSAPTQQGGSTAVQARVRNNSIEIAVFRPFLESLTTDIVGGAGFRPYASRIALTANKLYTHDDKNRSGTGSPYPWLELTGAPNSCPSGSNGDDGLTAAQIAALESGTRVNTPNKNPCYAQGSVYELDNAGTLASLATKTDVIFNVDLSLVSTDSPDPANVNGTVTYTITVTNDTLTGTAQNVTVVDTLPASVTFLGASAGCNPVGGVVTCALGTLASTQSKIVTITVRPNATGTIFNTAVVTSGGDELTPANNTDTEDTTVNPPLPFCPDGTIDPGEVCDDGNMNPNDGCENNCKRSNGQACEDASECASAICDMGTCEPANKCGNGVLENDEVCDDSNTTNGDGCEATCKLTNGEDCTDNGQCDSNICDMGTCEAANTCGNGVLEGTEVCDDSNTTGGDGCEGDCRLSNGEDCSADGQCSSGVCDEPGSGQCEPAGECGNGTEDKDEACDDGNTTNGDGCSAFCLIEDGRPCNNGGECVSGVCEGTPTICGGSDTDRDGIRDLIDLDDDNDGLLDTAEGGLTRDTDGDSSSDSLDLDSDNDGIPDATEAGHGHADNDGDFFADCPEKVGGNGFCNGLETAQDSGIAKFGTADFDGDETLDVVDLDSDNDGIADLYEGGAGCKDMNDDGVCDGPDVDHDGIADTIDHAAASFGNVAALRPMDFDQDGVPDYHDLDSDNDKLWDIQESKHTALDVTGDGVIDAVSDGDDDGARDVVDDSDLDGTADSTDPDPKKFAGLHDARIDTDRDAMPDHQDVDGDGDGFGPDDNCPRDPNPDQVDTDRDGLGDACDDTDERWGVAGGGCGTTDSSSSLVFGFAMLWIFTTRRRRARLAMLLGCVLAIPTLGHAQVVDGELNVERFQLASDGDGILDVESGRVRRHLEIDLALWLGYANDPLTVHAPGRDRVGSLVKNQFGGELVGSIGLLGRLQIGIGVPLVLSQTDDIDSSGPTMPSTPGSSFAIGDLRVMTKVALLDDRHGLDLAVIAAVSFPTSSGEGLVGDSWLTFAPAIAASVSWGGIRTAVNAGYRFREQTRMVDLEVNDELFAGLAAAYDLHASGGPPLELELGFGAATPAGDVLGAFNRNYAELKPGASFDFDGPLSAFVASGFGVAEGYGTPDWRVLAGVRLDRKMPEEAPAKIADTDHDGLLDNVDKCAGEAEDIDEFEDGDGCPELDNDKDGFPDKADKCPLEPEDKDGFVDDDGCPDLDNDNDGIIDTTDKCPLEAEDKDGFEDDNGCPEPDNDDDTVLDAADRCPIVAGPVENTGCPWPDRDGDTVADRFDNCPEWPGKPEFNGCNGPQLVKLAESKLELLDTILFATRKTTIEAKSNRLLDAAALVLKNHTELHIEIEGHTDDRGTDAFNLKLSEGRAAAVKNYFVKKGVPADRLTSKGLGEAKPIAENTTPDGRAKNRRVELILVRTVPAPQPAPAPLMKP